MRPRFIGVSAFLALAALLFAALPAGAQDELARVSITGPGLNEPLVIDDPQVLQAFAFDGFKITDQAAALPEDTGGAYTITRYVNQGGALAAYDRLLYLPETDDQAAHVFYEGLVAEGQRSPLEDQWYRVSDQSERVLAGLLPEPNPVFGAITPFFAVPVIVPGLMALAVLAVLGLIIFLQRRSIP